MSVAICKLTNFRKVDRFGSRRAYSSGFCRMMTLVPTGTRS